MQSQVVEGVGEGIEHFELARQRLDLLPVAFFTQGLDLHLLPFDRLVLIV